MRRLAEGFRLVAGGSFLESRRRKILNGKLLWQFLLGQYSQSESAVLVLLARLHDLEMTTAPTTELLSKKRTMLALCPCHHNTPSKGKGDFWDGRYACSTITLWATMSIESMTVQRHNASSLTETSMHCQSTPELKSHSRRGRSILKQSWKEALLLS
jgi:hypothetical protein